LSSFIYTSKTPYKLVPTQSGLISQVLILLKLELIFWKREMILVFTYSLHREAVVSIMKDNSSWIVHQFSEL
jgi:hypothetical protein